jgi:hypothetical protein
MVLASLPICVSAENLEIKGEWTLLTETIYRSRCIVWNIVMYTDVVPQLGLRQCRHFNRHMIADLAVVLGCVATDGSCDIIDQKYPEAVQAYIYLCGSGGGGGGGSWVVVPMVRAVVGRQWCGTCC